MAYNYSGGRFQAFDSSGDPLASGKVYTYYAGTTTPLASYTTQAATTPNANPVILDSAGRASIWLGPYAYRIILKTSADVTVWDDDNVQLGGVGQVSEETFIATAGQTLFTVSEFEYTPGNNSLQVLMNGLALRRTADYAETSSTSFTLTTAAEAGDEIIARAGEDLGANVGTNASAIAYDPPGAGAVATNVQARLRELHSVTDYGAVGDGVTDDTAAIQAGIDAVATAGGGDLYFPPGVFATDELSITSPRVRLVGAGAGWFSGTHTERGTTLLYIGAAAGVVLTLSSVSGASNEKISDCAILGIAIDGDEIAGTGLLVASVNRCDFDVSIAGCTSVQCEWKTVATLADTTNNQHNHVRYMRVKALNTANGIKFDTDVLPGNTSFNTFGYLYAQHADGYGIRIGNTDNNVFQHVVASRSSGAGIGIILGAGDNVDYLNCRANQILICNPGDGGLTAEGTPTDVLPSAENRIWYYDKDNATSDPTIETDAKLSWGTTDSVFSNFGFIAAGFGNSAANVINATEQAIAASFPVVIASGNGNHQQFDNGNSGKWNFKVNASTGQFSLVRAGGTGLLALQTAYLGDYANDGAAAAGGVAVGELYRNGSVLMIRVA